MRICALLLALVAGLSATPSLSAELRIEGLSEEFEENVRLSVGLPISDRADRVELFVDTLPDEAARALAALGYYSPDIRVSVINSAREPVIVLNVELNQPVRINSLVLNIEGDARLDPDYMPVLGRIPLLRNAVFNSGDYETAKSIMIDAAQERGYFDFAFTTRSVRVSRRQLTADITLVADSGQRYTFGALQFKQNVFTEAFLERWIPISPGDPYESSKLAVLTNNLQSSGYFSSVRVLPQRDRRYGKTVPVTIELERRDNNQIGIGVGVATDTGPRTKFTWGKPLINRSGHSAEAELGLSQIRQNVSFAYRIPRRNQPLYNYWGIEFGLQNEDKEDTESFLSTLNFQRVRRLRNEWTESVFVRWEREQSTIGNETDRTDLVLPGFSYSRNRSAGSPFATWGQSESVQFYYGSRELLSTIDFYKSVVTFKYLKAIAARHTLIGSLQYGAISTNDFDRVPASQRFFAGGDRSIRGFKFEQVSPRNPEGDAVGGRYLEVSSAEYNYRFRDRWSLALFVDAGRAFNNFDQAYSVGAGVGVRWQSPVGPFRLDLATPVSTDDNSILLHLSLGPDL